MNGAYKRSMYSKLFVHYGSNVYDDKKVTVTNRGNKPKGGLWASPVYSNHCWKKFCKDADFEGRSDFTKKFVFKMKSPSTILLIDSIADLVQLPLIGNEKFKIIDFEKMAHDGIAAIYMTERGQYATQFAYIPGTLMGLYGWDCESILIMKPNSIVLVEDQYRKPVKPIY